MNPETKPKKDTSYFQNTRENMFQYIAPDVKTTLEIGCAVGNFSKLIADRYNAQCWGVEIDPACAAQASKQLHKVFNEDITHCLDKLPDNYFDCIIMNDVLEHLTDPESTLLSLLPKLNENGVFVLSIPNVRYWRHLLSYIFRGEWEYTQSGILDNTHVRFFTIKSIRKMFARLGFEILTLEGIEQKRTITSTVVQIVNWLLLNRFVDTRFVNFACVAKPAAGDPK